MRRSLSRREWISRWLPSSGKVGKGAVINQQEDDLPKVAIIQGRFCLAHRKTFCSVCHERCPVNEAIRVDHGIPMVNPEACTGCGICHDVCPAPRNAVWMKVRA